MHSQVGFPAHRLIGDEGSAPRACTLVKPRRSVAKLPRLELSPQLVKRRPNSFAHALAPLNVRHSVSVTLSPFARVFVWLPACDETLATLRRSAHCNRSQLVSSGARESACLPRECSPGTNRRICNSPMASFAVLFRVTTVAKNHQIFRVLVA